MPSSTNNFGLNETDIEDLIISHMQKDWEIIKRVSNPTEKMRLEAMRCSSGKSLAFFDFDPHYYHEFNRSQWEKGYAYSSWRKHTDGKLADTLNYLDVELTPDQRKQMIDYAYNNSLALSFCLPDIVTFEDFKYAHSLFQNKINLSCLVTCGVGSNHKDYENIVSYIMKHIINDSWENKSLWSQYSIFSSTDVPIHIQEKILEYCPDAYSVAKNKSTTLIPRIIEILKTKHPTYVKNINNMFHGIDKSILRQHITEYPFIIQTIFDPTPEEQNIFADYLVVNSYNASKWRDEFGYRSVFDHLRHYTDVKIDLGAANKILKILGRNALDGVIKLLPPKIQVMRCKQKRDLMKYADKSLTEIQELCIELDNNYTGFKPTYDLIKKYHLLLPDKFIARHFIKHCDDAELIMMMQMKYDLSLVNG